MAFWGVTGDVTEGNAQADGCQHADHDQHDAQHQHEDGVQARADQVAFALIGGGDFFGRAVFFQDFQGHLFVHRFAGLLAALFQHILQDRADLRLDIGAGLPGQAASDFRNIGIDQVCTHSHSPSNLQHLFHHGHDAGPFFFQPGQERPAFIAEHIIAARAVSFDPPGGLQQSLAFQPAQQGVERALVDLEPGSARLLMSE